MSVDLDIENYKLEDILNLFKVPLNFKEEDMKKPAKGTYTFDDGSVYTGDLLNGKPNGLGEIKYAENNERGRISYVGEVKEGKPDGKGKMTLTYWRMYDGDFKDGMFLLLAGTEYMAIDV